MTSYGTANRLVVFFGIIFISVDNTFVRPKVNHKKVTERSNLEGYLFEKRTNLRGFPGSDSWGFFFL